MKTHIANRYRIGAIAAILLVCAISVPAQTATVSVCGTVSAYVAPTGSLAGLIVIGGQTIPIAVGTTIDGSGNIAVGADLCLTGSLDLSGQLVAPAHVTLNASAAVHVCGVLSAYTAATALVPGSISIGGQTIPISIGTAIDGAGQIAIGANLCLDGTVNGLGQLTAPASVMANATVSVHACGVVSAYTAATAASAGSITIGGQTIPIAAGTTIDGERLITAGADLCLDGTLNASGQLIAPSSVSAEATTSVSICGVVSGYVAATASSVGSLTIGGRTIPIAAGTNVDGAGLITVGADLCLHGTLNVAGQLVAPSSVTANASTTLSICGVITAYSVASASAPGSITIAGRTLSIAAGTSLQGAGSITLGANACLEGTLNLTGQLVPPSVITVTASTSVDVCGLVSAFTPATATAPGSITIGGRTFTIAAGTTLGFPVTVGTTLCANLVVSPAGNPGEGGNGGEVIGGTGGAAPREIVFPVAARLVGRGGAFWETDLRILNLGSTPATVTIEWYPFAPVGTSGPARSISVIVNPGAQGVYDQTLSFLFDSEGGGSLRLVSQSTSVGAALRLFHDGQEGPCDGTFGMFEKGLLASEVASRGALLVLGNRPDDANHLRTNLGYFNASPHSASLTFRVFATDGRVLGTKTMTVPGFANDQKSVFALVDSVAQSDRALRDLYVTFETQGGMPFIYGAAVYNSTNDALYVVPWQY